MGEAVGDFTGKKVGATFFRGKKPIDGVWTTADIVITGACVMPAGFGIGDHRLFVLDFLTSLSTKTRHSNPISREELPRTR